MKEPAANKPAGSWMPRFRVTAEKERPKKKKKQRKETWKFQRSKKENNSFRILQRPIILQISFMRMV